MILPCHQEDAVVVEDSSSTLAVPIDDSKSTTSELFEEEYSSRMRQTQSCASKSTHNNNALHDDISPLEHLVNYLREGGNHEAVLPLETLQTGYYNHPTLHQLASYGAHVEKLVRTGNVAALSKLLAYGLSPNAWNPFYSEGEGSLLHDVCSSGQLPLLQVLEKSGACLFVCDHEGRTLLHAACMRKQSHLNINVAELLLERDPIMLFMMDKKGFLPFSYIAESEWHIWKTWMNSHLHVFFGPEAQYQPSLTAMRKPHSCPLRPPRIHSRKIVSLDLLRRVAQGKLTPKRALLQQELLKVKRQSQYVYLEDDAVDANWACTRNAPSYEPDCRSSELRDQDENWELS